MKNKHKIILIFFVIPGFIALGVLLVINSNEFDFQGVNDITGTVIDGAGTKIENARVRLRGEKNFVFTDNNGRFRIKNEMADFKPGITAGKEGWFNEGAIYEPEISNFQIQLQPVPSFDDPHYRFVITSPLAGVEAEKGRQDINCANCHISHLEEWKKSTMARTVENKNVMTAYESFIKEKQNFQKDTCADCHAPLVAADNPGKIGFKEAVISKGNLSKGIECDFCHKVEAVDVSNKPGVQAIVFKRKELAGGILQRVLAFGPYDDVITTPMRASYSPLFQKSEYCSSCHQDAFPLPGDNKWDVESVYAGASKYKLYEKGYVIPNQWTYQEWLEWQEPLAEDDPDKGRQCQDCHMTWSKDLLPYYEYVVSGEMQKMAVQRDPNNIYPHSFEGTTQRMLESSSQLELEGDIQGSTLKIKARVTNTTAGHRLPTGELSRNLILLIKAEDEEGHPLEFVSGPTVPMWGGTGNSETDHAGKPGKGFARITADENGEINIPVWKAIRIAADNRIKPKETDISEFSFRIKQGSASESISVSAMLIYREFFRNTAWEPLDVSPDMIINENYIEIGDE